MRRDATQDFTKPHVDSDVTNLIKYALSMTDANPHENIASFVSTLLRARGFSPTGPAYLAVLQQILLVNIGQLDLDSFLRWLDKDFPDNTGKDPGFVHCREFGRSAFAAFIKELREKRGLTRAQVALRIDISPSQITKFEQGESFPSNENLIKLARVLDYHPARLWALGHMIDMES